MKAEIVNFLQNKLDRVLAAGNGGDKNDNSTTARKRENAAVVNDDVGVDAYNDDTDDNKAANEAAAYIKNKKANLNMEFLERHDEGR